MKIFLKILLIYIVTFLIDYFILKNLNKFKIDEYSYMKKRYKLKKRKVKNIRIITSLLNSLIMTFVCIFILYVKLPLILSFFIGFIFLILLIYSIYGIYGNILRKWENEKRKIK